MTYATLLVHLDLFASNAAVLRAAHDIAESFRADVIGIAIRGSATDVAEPGRRHIDTGMREAEQLFRNALAGGGRGLSWCPAVDAGTPADHVLGQVARADLIIAGIGNADAPSDKPRRFRLDDLVMRAGRPVLVVPETEVVGLGSAMIGWKDTREARRAIHDALPLLKTADRVSVVTISIENQLQAARDGLARVVEWLARHDIAADSDAVAAFGDDAAQLDLLAWEKQAGLLVTGAYGHNRVREWVLGGVTRRLLRETCRLALLSH